MNDGSLRTSSCIRGHGHRDPSIQPARYPEEPQRDQGRDREGAHQADGAQSRDGQAQRDTVAAHRHLTPVGEVRLSAALRPTG